MWYNSVAPVIDPIDRLLGLIHRHRLRTPEALRNWPERQTDLAARAQQWDLAFV